jgi:uncharacterized protein YkwD
VTQTRGCRWVTASTESVTSPTPTPVRLAFVVIAAAFVAAMLVAPAGATSAATWGADLAPGGACADADEGTVSVSVKRDAITCLVNWARARHRRHALTPSRPLRKAAVLKGERVASCGALTHAPCGTDPLAEVRATGFRFSRFGENIWAGPMDMTARGVVAGWLGSPRHRAILLQSRFRLFGAGLVAAPGFLGDPHGGVWVATFASRR